jgi:glycosyltransferase involved in cell wall biosynthesis
MQQNSLVTVAIVALNRAWISEKVLSCIQTQNYPHNRIFVLFVDEVNSDGTADLAKQKLAQADFAGYEVLVQQCSIPKV